MSMQIWAGSALKKNLVRHGKKRDHEFEGECGEVYEKVWMEEAKERNYNIMSIIL